MALKKILAGYKDADGNWVEQQEVDMDPLEEAEILAYWAVGEHLALKPQAMSDSEKLSLILAEGVEAVQAAQSQFDINLAAWQAEHQPLVDAYEIARQAYEQSVGE